MTNVSDTVVLESLIYLQTSGSRLYGTATEHSDHDVRGVAIMEDPSFYFGWNVFEQKDKWSDGRDMVVYDIRKALKLICDGNPNMVELIFTPDEYVIHCSEEWQVFRNNRYQMISQTMVQRYFGWAYSEYKKIMNSDQVRGKQMSHTVRLLRMLHELLMDGEIVVVRPDAEELLSIREGAWDLNTFEQWYHGMRDQITRAQETTSLRRTVDRKLIETTMCEIIQTRLDERE